MIDPDLPLMMIQSAMSQYLDEVTASGQELTIMDEDGNLFVRAVVIKDITNKAHLAAVTQNNESIQVGAALVTSAVAVALSILYTRTAEITPEDIL